MQQRVRKACEGVTACNIDQNSNEIMFVELMKKYTFSYGTLVAVSDCWLWRGLERSQPARAAFGEDKVGPLPYTFEIVLAI